MSARSPYRCNRSDAVLALYLDGDVDDGPTGFEFARAEAVACHLRECPSCQRELQRARRLDAVLAENAGRSLGAHVKAGHGLDLMAQRWWAAVHAAPAAAPNSASIEPSASMTFSSSDAAREHRLPVRKYTNTAMLAAVLGGICLLFVAAIAGRQRGPACSSANVPTVTAATATRQHPALDSALRNAEAGGIGNVPAPPCETTPQASDPGFLAIADSRVRRGSSPQPPVTEPATASSPPGNQGHGNQGNGNQQALHHLLAVQAFLDGATGSRRGYDSLVRELAASRPSIGGKVVMAAAHTLAADDAGFVCHLRAALQRLEITRGPLAATDLAAFVVASRLGLGDLDAAVLRGVRRHPELAPSLAAAVRSNLRRNGHAALLLDAWSDLAERIRGADGEAAAGAWFAGQPADVFEELALCLATERSSPRRQRCLRALAHTPLRAQVDLLAKWCVHGSHAEAAAAARALRQLPDEWYEHLLLRPATDRAANRLRAALAPGNEVSAPEDATQVDRGSRPSITD